MNYKEGSHLKVACPSSTCSDTSRSGCRICNIGRHVSDRLSEPGRGILKLVYGDSVCAQ